MTLGALASVFAMSTEEWQSSKLKLSSVYSLVVAFGCLFLVGKCCSLLVASILVKLAGIDCGRIFVE